MNAEKNRSGTLSDAFFAVQRARAIVTLVHEALPDCEDYETTNTLDFAINAAEDQLQTAICIIGELQEGATA